MTIQRPFSKFNLRHEFRLQPSDFISSFVNAHIVRFFSGRLAKGQVPISSP
jgi:hypothetical protein